MVSHPSWVCGLKLWLSVLTRHSFQVTPFVGVWIETSLSLLELTHSLVTPFVGVWIETGKSALAAAENYVTPFVGVWIETNALQFYRRKLKVTPFVGVWIETFLSLVRGFEHLSHPSWVCGLKQIRWYARCVP